MENWLKNTYLKIKSFKHKTLTGIISLLICALISYFLPFIFLEKIGLLLFALLVLFGFYQYAVSVCNYFFKEKDYFLGTVFALVGLGFISFLVYILFFH